MAFSLSCPGQHIADMTHQPIVTEGAIRKLLSGSFLDHGHADTYQTGCFQGIRQILLRQSCVDMQSNETGFILSKDGSHHFF